MRDLSSAGRASALQAGGHRFEPYRSHLLSKVLYADVAQLAEQLICNQQVIGSSPIIGFMVLNHMDGFPSGQRGQTVNLLQIASVVRIHLHPFRWCGGIGRRKGLKIPRGQPRAGSSPATSIKT